MTTEENKTNYQAMDEAVALRRKAIETLSSALDGDDSLDETRITVAFTVLGSTPS